MQNSVALFNLSLFDQKHPFWANLVQKIKLVSLSWNLVARLIWKCRIQWWFHFFHFWLELPLLGKLGPKNQNCQFKLKFGTYTNSNKQNSVALFCFRPETLFLGKYGPKNQTCQFKLKFSTYINSDIQNSMVVFIFSVLYPKNPFW